MTDNIENDGADDLNTRINQETGVITWAELARHFARGVVISVEASLDLVEVAACMIRDDTQTMKDWLESNKVRRASDDDARDWARREPEFWCVVSAPWVLVQEKFLEQDEPAPQVIH